MPLNIHLTYGKGGKKKSKYLLNQDLEQPFCKLPSGAFGGLCGLSDKRGSFKLRCTVNTHAHTGLYFLSDYHHPLANEFGLIRSFYHRAGTVSNIEALTRKRERPLKSCGSPSRDLLFKPRLGESKIKDQNRGLSSRQNKNHIVSA